MKVTKEDLFRGNSTTIKNNIFLRTEEYIKQFFDHINAKKYVCYVKEADQISNNLIVYNRILIDAIINEHNDWQEVISMSYAIDEKTPNIKLYKGWIKDKVYVLSSEILTIDLKEDWDVNLIDKLNSDSLEEALLKYNFYSIIEPATLGNWVYNTMNTSIGNYGNKVKLSINTPVNVYKIISEEIIGKEDTKVSGFNIYETFISESNLEEKDLHHRAEKIRIINDII